MKTVAKNKRQDIAEMGTRLVSLVAITSAFWTLTPVNAAPKGDVAIIQLLQTDECPGCTLSDADLVHAELRDANLEGAKLQRANLSQAQLDGANLRNSDLSFTSLRGASLRGTNLQGSRLVGTDLRDADLTGARLDANALDEAYCSGAKGLTPETRSYAALHNAGVSAAEEDRWRESEELFGMAIRNQPNAAESWVARAISRERLGKLQLAIQDFEYANALYKSSGELANSYQLEEAIAALKLKSESTSNIQQSGNGAGSAVLNGLLSTSKALLPLAMKLLAPALKF